jgi:hypothetical protein
VEEEKKKQEEQTKFKDKLAAAARSDKGTVPQDYLALDI